MSAAQRNVGAAWRVMRAGATVAVECASDGWLRGATLIAGLAAPIAAHATPEGPLDNGDATALPVGAALGISAMLGSLGTGVIFLAVRKIRAAAAKPGLTVDSLGHFQSQYRPLCRELAQRVMKGRSVERVKARILHAAQTIESRKVSYVPFAMAALLIELHDHMPLGRSPEERREYDDVLQRVVETIKGDSQMPGDRWKSTPARTLFAVGTLLNDDELLRAGVLRALSAGEGTEWALAPQALQHLPRWLVENTDFATKYLKATVVASAGSAAELLSHLPSDAPIAVSAPLIARCLADQQQGQPTMLAVFGAAAFEHMDDREAVAVADIILERYRHITEALRPRMLNAAYNILTRYCHQVEPWSRSDQNGFEEACHMLRGASGEKFQDRIRQHGLQIVLSDAPLLERVNRLAILFVKLEAWNAAPVVAGVIDYWCRHFPATGAHEERLAVYQRFISLLDQYWIKVGERDDLRNRIDHARRQLGWTPEGEETVAIGG